jgi:hypothetical protein
MRLLNWLLRAGFRFVTPECNTWCARVSWRRK